MERLEDYLNRIRSKYKINFTIYEDQDVNAFFWVACLLGGVLRSQKVNRILKKFWLVYHIVAACVIVFLNIGGFLQQTDRSWLKFAEILKSFMALLCLYSIYALFYYNQQNVERYTEDVNTYLHNLPSRVAGSLPPPNKSSSFFKFICANIFIMYSICGIPFFFPLFNVLQIKSYALFFATAFAQVMSIIPNLTGVFMMMSLENSFLSKMSRAFSVIIEQMRNYSEIALKQLESNHNRELLIERHDLRRRIRTAYIFANGRKRIEDRFAKEISYLAKRYQDLMKIRDRMKSLIEILFSVVSTSFLAAVILAGKHVLWVLKHSSHWDTLTFLLIGCAGTQFHLLYRLCNFANTLDDMVDTVAFEVYSTPWYLLSKKTRQTIYILIVQTQNPYRFKMYKTTPIQLSLLPKFLDFCYKYSSVLETLLERSM